MSRAGGKNLKGTSVLTSAWRACTRHKKQALLRNVWDQRIAENIVATNFEQESLAQGRAWADVDSDGKLIRRWPGVEREI